MECLLTLSYYYTITLLLTNLVTDLKGGRVGNVFALGVPLPWAKSRSARAQYFTRNKLFH